MLLYAYVTLLLLVIFFVFFGFKVVNKVPKKIRNLSIITLIFILIRYTVLILMFLQDNLKYMYMLKVFYFLYFISIPMCGMISLYILLRSDKINFSNVSLISLILITLYLITILKIPADITLSSNYVLGYTIKLENNFFYIDILYLIFNVIFLIISVNIFNKNKSDKFGSSIAIFSSLSTIVTIMLPYVVDNVLPQYVIGELLWSVTLVYCLKKIEKNN